MTPAVYYCERFFSMVDLMNFCSLKVDLQEIQSNIKSYGAPPKVRPTPSATYNIILNTVPEAGSSPLAAPLGAVYTH